MHRAIPIAAICSVAIHLTGFALAQLLYGSERRLSIASRVLVLDVSVPNAEPDPVQVGSSADDAEGSARSAPAAKSSASAESEESSAVEPPPERMPLQSTTRSVATENVATADASVDRVAQSVEPAAAPVEEVGGAGDSAAYVATVSASGQQVAADAADERVHTAPSEPVSTAQAEMLARKFEKWTQSYDRIRKTAEVPFTHHGQSYVAKFTELPAANDQGIEQVLVEISTERNGERLTTQMHMRRLAFSNYAQFVDRLDPEVRFHDDELDGRFHSNSEITLNRDGAAPRFHGKVTTAARSVDFGDRPGYVRRDSIFLGGLETGVDSIQFPERFVPFPADTGERADRVRHFDEDTRITFYADGSYRWRALEPGSEEHRAAISENPVYLMAAAKVELHVAGTVNGKVLVYAPERIVIDGNLAYAQDPATTPEADDYLGLVSDRYIDIAATDVTGPGDLTIDAAIYAKRRFAVREYDARGSDVLNIYGSLTAGSLSATEPRYRTKVRFDRRLETLRPPSFPMTDRYEVESWDNEWRVEETRSTL